MGGGGLDLFEMRYVFRKPANFEMLPNGYTKFSALGVAPS